MFPVQVLDAPETARCDGRFLAAFWHDLRAAFGVETHARAGREGAEEALHECGHGGGHDEDGD